MLDGNINTYSEFNLPEDGQGDVRIVLSSTKPIVSSKLNLLLDNYVALPNTIEIRANNKIIVASKKMNSQTIYFPEVAANKFIIDLTYGQPLRISELRLYQRNATEIESRAIRFLAQPGHDYEIYFNPDRIVDFSTSEAGNLAIETGVIKLPYVLSSNNPEYIIADVDVFQSKTQNKKISTITEGVMFAMILTKTV